ncbi:hypothetical protein BDV96DRAFT_581840 [Lophiotrema nucula]|uniref:HAD-like domain-containing protein n=1 Tax=Lophiotrema nucula TaxID=690887 RepID=A0A6A5Z0E0_9PLEO|nr:hypothetical protein BDV96DRAFT_581840 [Lophiotrema nucula]
MQQTSSLRRKKNLLLAFDAFGTLFTPKVPVFVQYGEIARRHGVACPSDTELAKSFKNAFKLEAKEHPNYGRAVGMGASRWWENVITKTFQPYLKQNEDVPKDMISDLLTRFSTKDGYAIYRDVLPFFEMLRSRNYPASFEHPWKWDKTIVGVITNSDDRVPGVLGSLGLTIGPRRFGSIPEETKDVKVDHDISFVVLSYDVGHEKPDQRMFDAGKNMLKETFAEDANEGEKHFLEDFELLYVGDELEKDYFGAQKAGWNAVLLDRSDGHEPQHADTSITQRQVYMLDEEGNRVFKQVTAIKHLWALSNLAPA